MAENLPEAKPIPPKPDTQEKELTLGQLKQSIKDQLLLLTKNDEKLKVWGYKIEAVIKKIGERLAELKARYPDDPDLYLFEETYADLCSDFERHEETELDASFARIELEMMAVMEVAGVRKESPDDEAGVLCEKITALRELGIQPEYVVTKGNPHAPTIVLFMQVHTPPTVTQEQAEAMGIVASQTSIKDAIISTAEAGMLRRVYDEVFSFHSEMSLKDERDPRREFWGTFQAKQKLGDRVTVMGYDVDKLKVSNDELQEAISLVTQLQKGKLKKEDLTPFQIETLSRVEKIVRYRVTSHNVFIASNLAALEGERQSKDASAGQESSVSFVIIGGGHEKKLIPAGKGPLPLSSVLAYYGMNVIVVDSARYFNPEALAAR